MRVVHSYVIPAHHKITARQAAVKYFPQIQPGIRVAAGQHGVDLVCVAELQLHLAFRMDFPVIIQHVSEHPKAGGDHHAPIVAVCYLPGF